MAARLGVEAARQVMDAPDKATRQALIAAALDERDLVPAGPAPAPATEPLTPGGPAPLFTPPAGAPSDPRLTGVTFDELWARFLGKIRHVDEGTTASLQPSPARSWVSTSVCSARRSATADQEVWQSPAPTTITTAGVWGVRRAPRTVTARR